MVGAIFIPIFTDCQMWQPQPKQLGGGNMAYGGYLLKIGDYKIDEEKFFRPESYIPYLNMQDLEPWTDSNGLLHRKPVKAKVAKVEFETPALKAPDFDAFMTKLRKQYTEESGRQCYFTAYMPELGEYDMQFGYVADFQPTIHHIEEDDTIVYNPIKLSVIGGVYHG